MYTRPTGFAALPPPRARNTCNRQAEIDFCFAAHPFRHGRGYCPADCPMLRQQMARHSQVFLFGPVAVNYIGLPEIGRTARHICQGVADQPPVQDSATATHSPCSVSCSPITSSKLLSSLLYK